MDGEVRRNRWGQPIIKHPVTGKEKGYQRVTTFAGLTDDTRNLTDWQIRMVLSGIALRPDLQVAILPYANDPQAGKRELKDIAEQALQAANSKRAANLGTALHSLTENVDRGMPLGPLPPEIGRDVAAYQKCVADNGLVPILVEVFVVQDELEVAGTADRVFFWPAKGKFVIGDLKSGRLDFGAGKIARQLAAYSRGTAYDPVTEERSPLPPVDQDEALVIHLPIGTGQATLHSFDIAAGWESCLVAAKVRDERKKKDWNTAISATYQAEMPAASTAPAPGTDPALAALVG